MTVLAESIRFVHIAFGFIGLAAFWVPVFSKKGASRHVLFGKVFVWSAYIVLAGAALALLLRVADLQHRNVMPADQPALYGFIVFLAYLTFVTFVGVRHGMAVLRHKGNPAALRTPMHLWLARAAIGASIAVIAYAVLMRPPNLILLFALSPIGFAIGAGNLRYIQGAPPSKRAWLYEHLGAMLGTGIAFHTAFAVFGAARLFDLQFSGWVGVIPWIAPAAIGTPAIAIWTRHYRRKFGELA